MARRLKNKKEEAKVELVDLEVVSVDVVDRAANKRKFLVVKNEEGVVTVEQGADDGLSLLDVLDITQPVPVPQHDETEIDLEEITKTVLSAEKDLEAALQNDGTQDLSPLLLPIAKGLSEASQLLGGLSSGVEAGDSIGQAKEGLALVSQVTSTLSLSGEALADETADVLATAAEAIRKAATVSDEEETTWPIAKGQNLAAVMNAAINKLAKDRFARADIVKKLAKAGKLTASTITQILRAEIKCAPLPMLKNFATVLGLNGQTLVNAAIKDGCRFELSKCECEQDDSPEIILKIGAKMRKTRLSQLKAAVQQLSGLLLELEGEDMDKNGKEEVVKTEEANAELPTPPVVAEKPAEAEKPEVVAAPPVVPPPAPVEKSETPSVESLLIKGFEALEKRMGETLAAKFDALSNDLTSKVEAVEKRVGKVENANPGGTEIDPKEKENVTKSADPMNWGGVLGL